MKDTVIIADKVEYATYHKRASGEWCRAGFNTSQKDAADGETAIMNAKRIADNSGETYATAKIVTRVTLT